MNDKNTYDYLESDYIAQLSSELALYLCDLKQGEFTLQDYYKIPDNYKVELIDGILYQLIPQSPFHQAIISQIISTIKKFINEKHLPHILFEATANIKLYNTDHTMAHPDISIFSDCPKIYRDIIFGSPDFIIEVVSPETKEKDLFRKSCTYFVAGVKEYWIVDLTTKQIIVYSFYINGKPSMYTFEDIIPIGILNKKCIVNFKEIYENTKHLETYSN